MRDRIAEIREAAKGLLTQKSVAEERVEIRVDENSVLPIYLGRSFPGGAFTAVIRSVSTAYLPINYRRPQILGMKIHWLDSKSKEGNPFDIVLELSDKEAEDIFIVFVARLCEVSEQQDTAKKAVQEIIRQIELWKHFFAGSTSQALSENRQTGLFGELTMLSFVMDAGATAPVAIRAWTGSSATNQDFEFDRLAIEVKSTTGADSSNFTVSNIRQLDSTGLDNLYLAKFAFDVRQGANNTLVSLVLHLREQVRIKSGYLQTNFEHKLLNAGYRDAHANFYVSRSYALRHFDIYEVKGDFPRLEETSLPAGISKVRYQVNLQGFDPYKEEVGVVLQKVIGAGIGNIRT